MSSNRDCRPNLPPAPTPTPTIIATKSSRSLDLAGRSHPSAVQTWGTCIGPVGSDSGNEGARATGESALRCEQTGAGRAAGRRIRMGPVGPLLWGGL